MSCSSYEHTCTRAIAGKGSAEEKLDKPLDLLEKHQSQNRADLSLEKVICERGSQIPLLLSLCEAEPLWLQMSLSVRHGDDGVVCLCGGAWGRCVRVSLSVMHGDEGVLCCVEGPVVAVCHCESVLECEAW